MYFHLKSLLIINIMTFDCIDLSVCLLSKSSVFSTTRWSLHGVSVLNQVGN